MTRTRAARARTAAAPRVVLLALAACSWGGHAVALGAGGVSTNAAAGSDAARSGATGSRATSYPSPRAAPGWSVRTVVASSYFHGVHGLAVAADGTVYAADVLGQTVWRIPAGSNRPEPLVPAPRGMSDDVSIAPDGELVWTSILTGVVYGRRPDGTIRAIAEHLPGINSVGFGPDGTLYASQLEGANRLYALPRDGGSPRLLLADNGGLNGFQIDAAGRMFAPQGNLRRVVRIDLATMHVDVLASGFAWPTGVKLGADGTPYVVDLSAGTLSRVTTGGRVDRLASLPLGIDNLAIRRDGRVLVSSPANNSIYVVDPRSRRVERWVAGRLAVPGGVAVAGDGRVLIADTFGFKAWDPRTARLDDLGTRPGSTMRTAIGVRQCSGAVVTTHWYSASVRVYDSNARQVRRELANFAKPQDAIALPDGSLLVLEAGEHRATRVAAGDDTRTTALSELDVPSGLTCADTDDSVLITDAGAGTVVDWNWRSGTHRVIARELDRPEGIARARDGTVYVSEAGARRIVRLARDGRVEPIVTDLPPALGPPPGLSLPWILHGLDVAPDGTVYFTSPSATALYAAHALESR